MSVTAPKKPAAKTTKGAPPVAAAAAPTKGKANTEKAGSGDLVPLNFKVDSEFHQDFKLFATMHKMSMVGVLKEAFELLKKEKGGA